MAETPKLLGMGSDAPGSSCKACGSDEMGAQKICVSDQTNGLNCSCKACESNKGGTQKISVSHQPNGLNFTNFKPDAFIVDVERSSRLPDRDATANSRITLQRSLSRKLTQPPGSEKDGGVIPSSSPKEIAAAVGGAKSPGNAMPATVGIADRPMNAQVHHHITITTGNAGPIAAENKSGTGSSAKKSSFRRSLPFWAIHFRRIPLYLAAFGQTWRRRQCPELVVLIGEDKTPNRGWNIGFNDYSERSARGQKHWNIETAKSDPNRLHCDFL